MNIHRFVAPIIIVIAALVALAPVAGPAVQAQAAPTSIVPILDWEVASAISSQAADGEAEASDAVMIPGLQVAVPRAALIWSLPILLLLIGFLIFSERRASRRKHGNKPQASVSPPAQSPAAANPLFDLGSNVKPSASKRNPLNKAAPLPARRTKAQDSSAQDNNAQDNRGDDRRPSAPSTAGQSSLWETPTDNDLQPSVHAEHAPVDWDDDDFDDELTMVPMPMDDEELTYRIREVERPIIGHLIRTNSDPNLPRELPIYGLNPAPGERRQIHIGRHSKQNTVVINDKRISREHAVMIQRDDRLYLRDNGSSAGTFLNWKRLSPGEELLLRHNDLISFGEVAYEFHVQEEPPAASD